MHFIVQTSLSTPKLHTQIFVIYEMKKLMNHIFNNNIHNIFNTTERTQQTEISGKLSCNTMSI